MTSILALVWDLDGKTLVFVRKMMIEKMNTIPSVDLA